MKLLFAFFTVLLCAVFSYAAIAQSAKDFHTFGWNAYGSLTGDVFNTFRNDASIAKTSHYTAGIIAEEKFMLQETTAFAFTAAFPVSSGAFGISGKSFGFENFRHIQTALIYGRKLTDWLDVGGEFDFLHSRVPAYGSAHAVTFGTGAIIHWNTQWHTGIQVFNPAKVKYSGFGGDAVPSLYRIGIGYQPSELFLLTTEISKTGEFPLEGTVVFYYRIIQNLSLTGGTGTGENNLFFGFNVHLKQIQILLAASHHSKLGFSPATGLLYENK